MKAVEQVRLRNELERAQRHVAEGREHIARQRRIISELERDGHDTGLARELLTSLEETQALHESTLARVAYELNLDVVEADGTRSEASWSARSFTVWQSR